MKSTLSALTAALFAALMSMPAGATYNATVIGTVGTIQQNGTNIGFTAETVIFTVSTQPTTVCSAGARYFILSPATITDAQTRKNLLAILMSAQARGTSVEVAYDSNNNGYCDQGYPAVYYIVAMS